MGDLLHQVEVVGDEEIGGAVAPRAARSRSSITEACTDTSSGAVISSQMTSSGLAAKARAIATRCFSPPESWCG